MRNDIHIISDNFYYKEGLKHLIRSKAFLFLGCSGKLVIIDASNVLKAEKIIIPRPTCQIIFLVSYDNHKDLFSTINYNCPVSYVNIKSSPDYLLSVIATKISSLSRRLSCRVFYNLSTQTKITDKEICFVEYLLQGKSIDDLSLALQLNNKTVMNYRSIVMAKVFYRLDTRSLRTFYVYKALSSKIIHENQKKSALYEDGLHCPSKKY